jgi:TatD DNase family protein
MNLIDTHTHLYLPEFDSDRDEIVARAVRDGVNIMLLPNIDMKSLPGLMNTVNRYPGICFPMIGLHPTSVKEDYETELELILDTATRGNFIAVGETGIDLYWEKKFIKEQIISFRKQIDLALKLNLPIVIHARESFSQIFEILADYKGKGLTGVFHAFTGGEKEIREVLDMKFLVGIGGIVTFKNSSLPQVIASAGISNIILETDSPYLAPVPHRGQRNESSYLGFINYKVATIFGLSAAEVAGITTSNAIRLFNLQNTE